MKFTPAQGLSSLHTEELDSDLMVRVGSGDEDALETIVRRHWAPLVSYSSRIVETSDAAEEVAQESFVRLWQVRNRWRPGGSVRAYLYQTARNLGLGRIRHLEVRRRKEPEVRRMLIDLAQPLPEEELADLELLNALRTAVNALPARRKEALILVRLNGLTLAQAAEKMGVSPQTVANHISLALDDLVVTLQAFRD